MRFRRQIPKPEDTSQYLKEVTYKCMLWIFNCEPEFIILHELNTQLIGLSAWYAGTCQIELLLQNGQIWY